MKHSFLQYSWRNGSFCKPMSPTKNFFSHTNRNLGGIPSFTSSRCQKHVFLVKPILRHRLSQKWEKSVQPLCRYEPLKVKNPITCGSVTTFGTKIVRMSIYAEFYAKFNNNISFFEKIIFLAFFTNFVIFAFFSKCAAKYWHAYYFPLIKYTNFN